MPPEGLPGRIWPNEHVAGRKSGRNEGCVVSEPTRSREPARLLVLVSGSGSNLQALLDACADPAYGAEVVAVGSDRDGAGGLARAADRGVATFVARVSDYPERAQWDAALTGACARYRPDLVVS